MRYLHQILTPLILALLPSLCAKAATETVLTVQLQDATKTYYLSQKPVISFTTDYLVITSPDIKGSPLSFSLSQLKDLRLNTEAVHEESASQPVSAGTFPVAEVATRPEPAYGLQPVIVPFPSLANAVVTLPGTTYNYTSQAIQPLPTVISNGVTLAYGTDYTVDYANNVTPGTATVYVRGTGYYQSVVVTKTFDIVLSPAVSLSMNRAAVTPAIGSLSADYKAEAVFDSQYGRVVVNNYYALPGQQVKLDITPKEGYYTTKDDCNYTLQPAVDPDDLGAARTRYLTIPDNGLASIAFQFNPFKDMTAATVSLDGDTYYYNGKAVTPQATVSFDGSVLTPDTDYTLGYDRNTDAGTAQVVVTGKGVYRGVLQWPFVISLKPTAAVTINGKAVTPVVGDTVSNQAPAVFTSEYGQVTIDNLYALPGSLVSFMVTPAEGFQIDKNGISPDVLFGVEPADLSAPRSYQYYVPSYDATDVDFQVTFKPVEITAIGGISGGSLRLSVFTAQGVQVVADHETTAEAMRSRLAQLPAGIYIVNVNNKSFKLHRK